MKADVSQGSGLGFDQVDHSLQIQVMCSKHGIQGVDMGAVLVRYLCVVVHAPYTGSVLVSLGKMLKIEFCRIRP